MKLSQDTSKEATLLGDIQNNKVGIDRNNIDFITTLLTSNLYSQPVQSFIRETVANGWDSQVEANNTEEPIIIRITDKDCKIIMSIRDYGTGLSPERFNEIYLNIGSSTKRESNDYIGQMGIGRFACLSCSNVAYVTSYFNGTKYQYIMYKDGASLCIDKLMEESTEEPNGVEVSVTLGDKYNYTLRNNIQEGISALHYYPNVHVFDEDYLLSFGFVDQFNQRKIHSFENFKVTSSKYSPKCTILMGNVCYPLSEEYKNKYFPETDMPIAIICPIGSLDITPNREALLYNAKTRETLDTVLTNTLEEIRTIARTQRSLNFNTINDWYNCISDSRFILTLYTFDSAKVDIVVRKAQMQHFFVGNTGITIKGKPVPSDLEKIYSEFIYCKLPPNTVTYKYQNGKFYRGESVYATISNYIHYYKSGLMYCIDEPYKPVTKQYMSKQIVCASPVWFISSRRTFTYFVKTVKTFAKAYTGDKITDTLRLIWQDFRENYFAPKKFNNSDVPDIFKQTTTSIASMQPKKPARKCVIYALTDGHSYNSWKGGIYNVVYDSNRYTLESLSRRKATIIYGEKDTEDIKHLYSLFGVLNGTGLKVGKFIFVAVASKNLSIFEKFKNAIYIEDICKYKNSIISKICTAEWLARHYRTSMLATSTVVNVASQFRDPEIKAVNAKIGYYKTIIDRTFDLYTKNREIKGLIDRYYEVYSNKGWLDIDFIQGIEAYPVLLEARALAYRLAHNYELTRDLLVRAFISTHDSAQAVDRKNAQKYLQNILHTNEPIQIT